MTRIALFALLLYVVMAGSMFVLQRKLQYFPRTDERTPEAVGLSAVRPVNINTPDGETLRGWLATAPPGQPTLLYLHGNGGGISDRPLKIQAFADAGFGVLALSYRGYEGSTGSPSETGLVTDGLAAYDWLKSQGVEPPQIMLLGESLGTGVAVQVAAQRPVAAIVLEAPFASAVDLGARAYWFLPVRLLMKDQFRSIDHIGRVKAPLLILHGKTDTLIPVAEGRRLFSAANQPKQMLEFDQLGHELVHDATIWAKETEFFRASSQAR